MAMIGDFILYGIDTPGSTGTTRDSPLILLPLGLGSHKLVAKKGNICFMVVNIRMSAFWSFMRIIPKLTYTHFLEYVRINIPNFISTHFK